MASYIGVSPPEQTGIVERYQFTGDGSTTVFSGNDNNGKEFRYISTNTLLVFLNGVQLVEDTDFTKTSNSQITFAVAPTAADELELLTFGSFDLNSPSTLRTNLGLNTTDSPTFASATLAPDLAKLTINSSLGTIFEVGPRDTSDTSNRDRPLLKMISDNYYTGVQLDPGGTQSWINNFSSKSFGVGESNPQTTLHVGGVTTIDGNLNLVDNHKIQLGAGTDLQLYHDGSDSYIKDAGTGDLRIESSFLRTVDTSNNHTTASFASSGVALRHSNSVKFQTTSTGATVTGSLVFGSNLHTLGSHGDQIKIGKNALCSNNQGLGNIALGYEAMKANVSGCYNTAVGHQALTANVSDAGSYNTAHGYQALYNNTTGEKNTAIGFQSMFANTSGEYNAAIGTDSLRANTTGEQNVALGHNSLYNNTFGNGQVAAGYKSLFNNTTGNYNVGLGAYNLEANVSGSCNVAIGYEALNCNKADRNVAVGYQVLKKNTTGSYNVGVGDGALKCNTTGNCNVGVGLSALQSNTSGHSNIAIGMEALNSNTTGIRNVSIGYTSLRANTIGINNVAVGNAAMYTNTTGTNNVAIGAYALYQNTTGIDNVAVGRSAVSCNTVGYQNIGIGLESLKANTTGFDNVSLGYKALTTNTTGGFNIAVGTEAGCSNTTGTANIVLGQCAFHNAQTGSSNVVLGHQAMHTGSGTIQSNVAIGTFAMYKGSNSCYNVAIGRDSGKCMNGGKCNVMLGYSSGCCISSGCSNVVLGTRSAALITTGCRNVAVGFKALEQLTTGSDNVAVGYQTLKSITRGGFNVALGFAALENAVDNSQKNVAIGYLAAQQFGNSGTGGANIVAVGTHAGQNITAGNVVIIGPQTACGSAGGAWSTIVGPYAAQNYTGQGTTVYGAQAGTDLTSGYSNTLLGKGAGNNITTGNCNTMIGDSAGNNTVGGTNNIVIGKSAQASGASVANEITLGNSDINCFRIPGLNFTVDNHGDVNLINDKKVIFGDAGEHIVGDGTDLKIASSGAINIDAVSGGVNYSANGTGYLSLINSQGSTWIRNYGQDKDILLIGNDGGSAITALHLDMSEAGAATFNGTVSMSGGQAIPGKIEGTNFTDSLLIGHSTTGTLSSADRNTGVGIEALESVTAGDGNTVLGYQSGSSITYGQQNTSTGANSLNNNVTGNYNSAYGTFTLQKTTASNNTAFGYQAGKEVIGGASNIFLGYRAGNNITSGDGNVVIGNGDVASATGDKQLKISDGVDGSVAWITGDSSGNLTTVGDVTLANDKKVIFGDAGEHIAGNGTDLTITSSRLINLDCDIVQTMTGSTVVSQQNTFGNNLTIKSMVENKDIIFQGNDGGTGFIALTLDMSDAGTAIFNHDILPTTDATQDLGSTSKRWNNIYTGDLHLSNESTKSGNSIDGTKGNWTLQEGQSDLFLINNNTGKKYKFKIEEIE